MQCWTGFAIAGLVLGLGAGSAAVIDLDDPRAEPLYFAVETLSAEAVIVSGRGAGGVTHYRLEGSPENAALRTTSRLALAESETWYVRADLDGMVFGATPEFATGGEGSGSGFASMEADVLQGGCPRGAATRGALRSACRSGIRWRCRRARAPTGGRWRGWWRAWRKRAPGVR